MLSNIEDLQWAAKAGAASAINQCRACHAGSPNKRICDMASCSRTPSMSLQATGLSSIRYSNLTASATAACKRLKRLSMFSPVGSRASEPTPPLVSGGAGPNTIPYHTVRSQYNVGRRKRQRLHECTAGTSFEKEEPAIHPVVRLELYTRALHVGRLDDSVRRVGATLMLSLGRATKPSPHKPPPLVRL